MQTIIEKLAENLQLIYRKAIDADNVIAQLRNDGKGKFTAIFAEEAGFNHQGKFFKPYVEELAKEVLELKELAREQQKAQLGSIVKRIELLHSTLGQFQQSIR